MGIDENIVAAVCVHVEGNASWELFIIDTFNECGRIDALLGFIVIETLMAGTIGITENHVRLAVFRIGWRRAKDVRSAILQEMERDQRGFFKLYIRQSGLTEYPE